ncbi:motility protein A [Campylobacter gastrosuis]|uniref:MotA/TolQ/ExbB proton channel family protein n=1 Tax=Campylobacter gastrosuis TaxID=2974576 RepID=A0ABT7HMJ1_9BACT|nr:MotA/TolQ/ExbB proton channel family protein [Campylobacter gastrosuis]MDL0087843.1 MotA/TolQ/ExbB proton channel family protein [Campylobacter gastrosuis]MDL0088054.1 MotA/TolQ/ExbB proton channel family protein [Campylobacter gastrosuis]
MDLGTVVGWVLTMVLLLGSMAIGVGIGPYIDIPSVMIVFGGTIGVLMVGFKMETLKGIGKFYGIAVKPPQINLPETIKKIVDYSTKARRDGILALESDVNNEPNLFLKKGLSMAVDGNEPDAIRALLEIDIDQTNSRHGANIKIFDQMGGFAGAMGMIGTLIGLVAMLMNMSDPSAIGPSMAVALLTTLYGAMIGNILGAPVANILSIRNDGEMLEKQIILEGIMSIQAGDNPRTLESKLLSYLAPKDRKSQFEQ